MKKLLVMMTISTALVGSRAALADDIKCDPEAKKLEWHICIAGEASYKKGLKTETRTEWIQDTVIKAVEGCKIENLVALVPAGKKFDDMYIYAIGPKDWDLAKTHERQEVQKNVNCKVGNGVPNLEMLMKFGDAMDKDNGARARMVEEKLAAKGKRVVTGLRINARQPEICKGKDAAFGFVDKKTSSKFMVYSTAKW